MKQKFVAISGEAITWRQSQFKCSVMCTLFFCNAAWKLPRITSLYSFAHRYYMLKKREVTACAITYIVFNHHHVGLGYTMKTSRQDSFERHFLWGALPKEKNYLTKLSRGSFSNEKQFCWFFLGALPRDVRLYEQVYDCNLCAFFGWIHVSLNF